MNQSTDKGRFVSATVLLIALSFGLLSLAQYARPLHHLSHAHCCALAHARLNLTRNVIEEVSPTPPRLPAPAWLSKRLLVSLVAPRIVPGQAVPTADVWPESGPIQRRRIPASSPDDPASL
ncbi:MAG: hypothetical protein ACLQU2_18505 [Candidatus Binataceae bacterium]